MTDLSEERQVSTENMRNELITAQNQLQAVDEQMSKDREKLLKLREDKRILLEKARTASFIYKLFLIINNIYCKLTYCTIK